MLISSALSNLAAGHTGVLEQVSAEMMRGWPKLGCGPFQVPTGAPERPAMVGVSHCRIAEGRDELEVYGHHRFQGKSNMTEQM